MKFIRSIKKHVLYITYTMLLAAMVFGYSTTAYVHAETTVTDAAEQYTTAINNLDDAIKELNESLSGLNNTVEDTRITLGEGSDAVYTPSTYNALVTELSHAEKLYKQLSDLSLEASDSLKQITTEYDKAVKDKDTGALSEEDFINKRSQLQTEAESALTKLAIDNSLKSISDSVNAIQNKRNSLIKQADKTKLKAKIETAQSKKKDNYFASEYNDLQTVIKEAQKVHDDKNASTKDVSAAINSLTNAISALRVIYEVQGNTRVYDITNFEANGNDSLSDSATIQAALDQSSEDYKIVIRFPKGTFYLSKALFIQSNTTMKLNNKTVIRRMDSSLKYNIMHSTDSGHKKNTVGGYELAHDIVIDGGVWDGGNISKATADSNLMYFGHCNNITIQNATIKNCYGSHAVEFAGVSNGIINNCKFSKFRYDSSNFTSEAIQLDICWKDSDGTAWAPGYKQDKTSCKNITITNNTINDYPRGIGTHHILSGHPYTNIVIKNNKIKSPFVQGTAKTTGVFLNGIKKITVNSNQIDSYHYGIWIRSSSSLTVKSNVLKYNSIANLIYAGNNVSDKKVLFTFVSVKDKEIDKTESPKSGKKKIFYTAPTMNKGYIKVGGKTYRFKKAKKYFTVNLKKKLKKNQKILMYGTDKYKNQFYGSCYVK